MPSQIVTSLKHRTTTPQFRKRTKAKPASESWQRIERGVKGLLANGRTTLGIYTCCDDEDVKSLWLEYAPQLRHMVDRFDPEKPPRISVTTLLDLISTAIIQADKLAKGPLTWRHDGVLSRGQWYRYYQHEVLFAEMDMFARAGERGEWRWHDGGWYGDAPKVIQEHLPREFSDLRRKDAEHVGIFWNPPWIA